MRLLLDTHIVVWALFEPARLSVAEKEAFLNPAIECCVSVVSLWEAEIKRRLGKLPIPESFIDSLRTTTLKILPVLPEHVQALQVLPSEHRDPFDRMIAAQAIYEEIQLITRDAAFIEMGAPLFLTSGDVF